GELMAMLVAGGRTAEAIAVARRGRARTLSDLRAEEPWQASRDEQRRAWESAAARFLAARDRLEKTVVRRWTLAGTDLARGQSAEPPHAHEASRAHAALAEALAVVSRAQRAANMPLASPGSGEVILGYHPMARAPNGRTSWMAYAVSANAVATARLGAIDVSAAKAEQAAQLLGPFDALIGKARRVRVLDYGPLVDVDFHALPYRGEALGVHRRIVYSLDLPPASSRLGPTVARSILVMGDPTGSLPAARREGEAVAAVLGQRRPGVVSLLGPQGEPGTNLRRLLPRADLFHYAGHGRFAAADGVGSALTLADGALLRLTDVLALAPSGVPRQVVLSGCETGRRGAKAGAGLGLAQAFVLVGSEEVVATARDVGDEVAGRLSIRMHEHARQTGDLAEALHLAQNQLSKEAPLADWAAFRVIVP
ncbi:MAG TPA: CHAT domain-containing protein, partial [Polyangia bacterium]